MLSQIFVKTMWLKFQQNRLKNVEIKDPYRHTHIHTHAETGIVLGQHIPSFHEMTEYKNFESLDAIVMFAIFIGNDLEMTH